MGVFRGSEPKILWTPPRRFEALTLAFCQKFAVTFTWKMEEKNSWEHDFGSGEMGVFRGSEPKILWTPPRRFEALTLAFCQKFAAIFRSKMKEKNSWEHDFGSGEMGVFRCCEPKILWTPPGEFEALTLAFCQKFAVNFTWKPDEKNSWEHDFGSGEMGVFRGCEPKIL